MSNHECSCYSQRGRMTYGSWGDSFMRLPSTRAVMRVIENGATEILSQYRYMLNNVQNRSNVVNDLTQYLRSQMVPEFIVICDNSNNTPESIDQHILNVDITVRPTTAAQFYQFRLSLGQR